VAKSVLKDGAGTENVGRSVSSTKSGDPFTESEAPKTLPALFPEPVNNPDLLLFNLPVDSARPFI
jgi:hypothetical protein